MSDLESLSTDELQRRIASFEQPQEPPRREEDQRWQDQAAVPGWQDQLAKLSPQEEQQFGKWRDSVRSKLPAVRGWEESEGRDPTRNDYDLRGYWRDVASKNGWKLEINPNDHQPHLPDTYKTPFHDSFSAESKFADPTVAPRWNQRDQLVAPDGSIRFDERLQNLSDDELKKRIAAFSQPTKPAPKPEPPLNLPGGIQAKPAPQQPAPPQMLSPAPGAAAQLGGFRPGNYPKPTPLQALTGGIKQFAGDQMRNLRQGRMEAQQLDARHEMGEAVPSAGDLHHAATIAGMLQAADAAANTAATISNPMGAVLGAMPGSPLRPAVTNLSGAFESQPAVQDLKRLAPHEYENTKGMGQNFAPLPGMGKIGGIIDALGWIKNPVVAKIAGDIAAGAGIGGAFEHSEQAKQAAETQRTRDNLMKQLQFAQSMGNKQAQQQIAGELAKLPNYDVGKVAGGAAGGAAFGGAVGTVAHPAAEMFSRLTKGAPPKPPVDYNKLFAAETEAAHANPSFKPPMPGSMRQRLGVPTPNLPGAKPGAPAPVARQAQPPMPPPPQPPASQPQQQATTAAAPEAQSGGPSPRWFAPVESYPFIPENIRRKVEKAQPTELPRTQQAQPGARPAPTAVPAAPRQPPPLPPPPLPPSKPAGIIDQLQPPQKTSIAPRPEPTELPPDHPGYQTQEEIKRYPKAFDPLSEHIETGEANPWRERWDDNTQDEVHEPVFKPFEKRLAAGIEGHTAQELTDSQLLAEKERNEATVAMKTSSKADKTEAKRQLEILRDETSRRAERNGKGLERNWAQDDPADMTDADLQYTNDHYDRRVKDEKNAITPRELDHWDGVVDEINKRRGAEPEPIKGGVEEAAQPDRLTATRQKRAQQQQQQPEPPERQAGGELPTAPTPPPTSSGDFRYRTPDYLGHEQGVGERTYPAAAVGTSDTLAHVEDLKYQPKGKDDQQYKGMNVGQVAQKLVQLKANENYLDDLSTDYGQKLLEHYAPGQEALNAHGTIIRRGQESRLTRDAQREYDKFRADNTTGKIDRTQGKHTATTLAADTEEHLQDLPMPGSTDITSMDARRAFVRLRTIKKAQLAAQKEYETLQKGSKDLFEQAQNAHEKVTQEPFRLSAEADVNGVDPQTGELGGEPIRKVSGIVQHNKDAHIYGVTDPKAADDLRASLPKVTKDTYSIKVNKLVELADETGTAGPVAAVMEAFKPDGQSFAVVNPLAAAITGATKIKNALQRNGFRPTAAVINHFLMNQMNSDIYEMLAHPGFNHFYRQHRAELDLAYQGAKPLETLEEKKVWKENRHSSPQEIQAGTYGTNILDQGQKDALIRQNAAMDKLGGLFEQYAELLKSQGVKTDWRVNIPGKSSLLMTLQSDLQQLNGRFGKKGGIIGKQLTSGLYESLVTGNWGIHALHGIEAVTVGNAKNPWAFSRAVAGLASLTDKTDRDFAESFHFSGGTMKRIKDENATIIGDKWQKAQEGGFDWLARRVGIQNASAKLAKNKAAQFAGEIIEGSIAETKKLDLMRVQSAYEAADNMNYPGGGKKLMRDMVRVLHDPAAMDPADRLEAATRILDSMNQMIGYSPEGFSDKNVFGRWDSIGVPLIKALTPFSTTATQQSRVLTKFFTTAADKAASGDLIGAGREVGSALLMLGMIGLIGGRAAVPRDIQDIMHGDDPTLAAENLQNMDQMNQIGRLAHTEVEHVTPKLHTLTHLGGSIPAMLTQKANQVINPKTDPWHRATGAALLVASLGASSIGRRMGIGTITKIANALREAHEGQRTAFAFKSGNTLTSAAGNFRTGAQFINLISKTAGQPEVFKVGRDSNFISAKKQTVNPIIRALEPFHPGVDIDNAEYVNKMRDEIAFAEKLNGMDEKFFHQSLSAWNKLQTASKKGSDAANENMENFWSTRYRNYMQAHPVPQKSARPSA